MWIDVDFKYGEPVVAIIYTKNSRKFMKSEAKLDKWKEKTIDKISQAVLKSLPKELYGTININIKGLDKEIESES